MSIFPASKTKILFCYWQITPLPGAWAQKPGSATFPFFGVQVLYLYHTQQFRYSMNLSYLFASILKCVLR